MKSILLIIILYSFLIIKTLSDNEHIKINLTIDTKFQLYAYFLRYYGFSNYYDINLQNENSYTDRISPKKLEIISTDYIIVNNTNYTRNLLYEEIEIESYKLSMYWYNIPQPLVGNINYTGMSFALKPKNESFSLIHILKKDNRIDKMIMALEISNNIGVMYLGMVPESFEKMPYKGEIRVKSGFWGCNINKIYFTDKHNANITNKYIVNKRNVLIQTGKNEIVVSKDFFSYIKENILKEYYKKGLCFDRVLSKIGYVTIDCLTRAKINEGLPYYFNIEIEDYVYSMNIEELMYQYKTMNFESFVRIGIATHLDESDVWMIGAIFLKKFNSVFDYENKIVKLYSQLPRIRKIAKNQYINVNWKDNIRLFILTIVILMIGGIIINVYVYKKTI